MIRFRYGQNDVNVTLRGDVIRLQEGRFVVASFGFRRVACR